MFIHRRFHCLKKVLSCYSRESYESLPGSPVEEKESSQSCHHLQHLLEVPKGFVPIIVGEVEGKERKKYMIQVEFLSSPIFKALIDKLWEEQEMELDLEDESEGPMQLPCTPEAFEQVLVACRTDEASGCKDRLRTRRRNQLP